MINCPYCGRKLEGDMAIPPMSFRQRVIYDGVCAAGNDGVDRDTLIAAIYPEGKPKAAGIVLRVQIHAVNKIISQIDQRIRGKRGHGYRLVKADAAAAKGKK